MFNIGSQVHINHINNHRQLIRLQGSLSWCYKEAQRIIAEIHAPYFWLGDAPSAIPTQQYAQILGQETSVLIINAHQRFDANLFAASSGTLRGGGILLLLGPAQIDKNDHFYQYIDMQLQHYSFPAFQEGALQVPSIEIQDAHKKDLHLEQQQLAIDAIIKTVTGRRRRPLVLSADRGRGKSAALGIASAQLIAMGYKNILICAPNKKASATLFRHCAQSAGISFIAPDALIAQLPSCDLLIVDEAAAIPVPLLMQISIHYSRLVFATTLDGYEGSGRGFALRFQKELTNIAPQWRALRLEQPIRWDNFDPLEAFTLNSLCLTKSNTPDPRYNKQQTLQLIQMSAQQLLCDPPLLNTLFALLVNAHYQTKPSDLEQLLNDPQLSIFLLCQHEQVLGVSIINHEGALDSALCTQIYLGKRRIKGHLIAQSLTFHCAQRFAATHRYARIQRIAIHPTLQGQGLGHVFVQKIKDWAIQENMDHLCAAFGATQQLLPFWQRLGFRTLRIGITLDKSSATHSFIVNQALSARAKALHCIIELQFQQQLAMQISRHLQQLDPFLLMILLIEGHKNKFTEAQDFERLHSYINGDLPYEFVEKSLVELIFNNSLSVLDKNQQKITIQKILQNRNWADICLHCHLQGKTQAQLILRTTIKQLIEEISCA
ncbi:ATPase [Psychromonas sp. CNPT3]|uniref:GNAT family N-acetyltransferase n=1 Tax=Psychromonas sp. CNPT3 TaxID=314282 RepID=UPI0002C0FA05|nr:GNAT family N-acetyltransferase [Psychromonas sp. CNPT3]AGH80146.1 ATPase [Psychromonas sp. CNPT3]